MNEEFPSFSVLLSTYSGNSPYNLRMAILSVLKQNVSPNELVIVEDGKLTSELSAVINEFREKYPEIITTVGFEHNKGIGPAHRTGVKACSNDLVAIMDADDISLPNRFEKQLQKFTQEEDVDVVGGYIKEFYKCPGNIHSTREVPCDYKDIFQASKKSMPTNHVSIMFRRESVIEAGNYRTISGVEDYDLILRLLIGGYTVVNIPEFLVKARIDPSYDRRGGFELAVDEYRLQRQLLEKDFITRKRFILNVVGRCGIRIAPAKLRSAAIQQFDRRKH